MSIYQNDVYRIRRNAEYQDEMKQLMQSGVFSNYYTILSVSALVGYYHNAYVPFEKTAERVSLTSFTANDKDLIDLIAVARTRSTSIIKDDKKYEIFENYANGGFPILLKKLNIKDLYNMNEDAVWKAQNCFYSLLMNDMLLPD